MYDVPSRYELRCKRCGASFSSYYYERGSTRHSNNTDAWNINVFITRGTLQKELDNMNDVDRNCVLIYLENNMPNIFKKL